MSRKHNETNIRKTQRFRTTTIFDHKGLKTLLLWVQDLRKKRETKDVEDVYARTQSEESTGHGKGED